MKKLLPLASVALLASCGLVQLPPVAIPDQHFDLPVPFGTASGTVYTKVLDKVPGKLPVSGLKLTGTSRVLGAGTAVFPTAVVEVYGLRGMPSCPQMNSVAVCPEPQGERIGTLQVGLEKSNFVLTGAVLDEAVKGGNLALGLRVLEGGPVSANSTIILEGLEVHARF